MNKKIIPIYSAITADSVPSEYQWAFLVRNQNFNKNLNKHGAYCYHPFSTITIDQYGYIFLCPCQSWLPINVGNIWDFENLEDILTHPISIEIQNSITNGSYKYCDTDSCGVFYKQEIITDIGSIKSKINWINFAFDNSCNLTCPSCRTEFKFVSEGPEYNKRIDIAHRLINLIEKYNYPLKLSLSNDGDPFASLIYRDFLTKLDLRNKNNITVELVTNGILLDQFWAKIEKIHKNISSVKVSIDAGSEEIYNQVRRGGNWTKLLSGINLLTKWKRETQSSIKLISNFVVQQKNYKDVAKYVNLSDYLGFDSINLQKIENWGTFKNFQDEAVWNSCHPEFEEFLYHINCVRQIFNAKVDLTNLASFVNNYQFDSSMMTLSQMVKIRNKLEQLDIEYIKNSIDAFDGHISIISNIKLHADYHENTQTIIRHVDIIEQSIDAISQNTSFLLTKINRDISTASAKFLKRGYLINGQFGSNKAAADTERSDRIKSLSPETYADVLSKMQSYADWHYPGLEIGPGDGVWTEHMVACDPLYLIDIEQEYLDNTLNKFNPVYRNRIRPYLTGGWAGKSDFDYSELPANQFGFIFAWNVFDYFPLHETELALSQCFNLLRPGGVMMFSFNNCDFPQCVEYVEKGFKSWMPTELLSTLCKNLKFEIINIKNPEDTVSWIELRKPGELKTVKAHQVLGKIIRNNI